MELQPLVKKTETTAQAIASAGMPKVNDSDVGFRLAMVTDDSLTGAEMPDCFRRAPVCYNRYRRSNRQTLTIVSQLVEVLANEYFHFRKLNAHVLK